MGTAEAQAIADQIVRQATASAGGKEKRASTRSSYAEVRSSSQARVSLASSPNLVFWKYLTAPPVLYGTHPEMADWSPDRYLFEPGEQRTLSKATAGAGGYLVPQDFGGLITSARRATSVIGNVARVVETDHGRVIPFPAPSSSGTSRPATQSAASGASASTAKPRFTRTTGRSDTASSPGSTAG